VVKTLSKSKLYLKSYFTFEYSAPVITGGGPNVDFKTSHDIFSQLRDIENIALGQHFRIHDYLGLQWNWAQTELDNIAFQDAGPLARRAIFKMDHVNFSALFFMPVEKNLFELFAEIGAADVRSRTSYVKSNGSLIAQKNHETTGIYGLGFQIKHFKNSDDAIRFSFQKYSGKLAGLDSHYSTVRFGYLKRF
jgi:hypothetical protein